MAFQVEWAYSTDYVERSESPFGFRARDLRTGTLRLLDQYLIRRCIPFEQAPWWPLGFFVKRSDKQRMRNTVEQHVDLSLTVRSLEECPTNYVCQSRWPCDHLKLKHKNAEQIQRTNRWILVVEIKCKLELSARRCQCRNSFVPVSYMRGFQPGRSWDWTIKSTHLLLVKWPQPVYSLKFRMFWASVGISI